MGQRRSALGLAPAYWRWSPARLEAEEAALVDAMTVEELRRAHEAEYAASGVATDPVALDLLLRRQVAEIPPEHWTPEEAGLVALWAQADAERDADVIVLRPLTCEESA